MKLISYLWACIAVLLILIILIQKGKGGGLSSAFGGAGAGGVLGTKTGDFLTWVTIGLVVAFLTMAVLMVKYYKPVKPLMDDTGGSSGTNTTAVDDSTTPGTPDETITGTETSPAANDTSDTPVPPVETPAADNTGGEAADPSGN